MKRTTIIAGNWKMNLGPDEASRFVARILPQLNQIIEEDTHLTSVIFPPTIALATVRSVMQTSPTQHVELGAQHMYFAEKGAFTGESSPAMVKQLCSYVLLGHSERRTIFGETSQLINRKVLAAYEHGLKPMLCVGENLTQHANGASQEVIAEQLRTSLAAVNVEEAAQLTIAYEPLWAIGTRKASDALSAGNMAHFIRALYMTSYGQTAADALHILYGGSVTSANVAGFISQADIDGVLAGGASVTDDFVAILHNASKRGRER